MKQTSAERYLHIQQHIRTHYASQAKIIAVTKGRPVADVLALYEVGCRDFGESRLDAAFEKMEHTPKDIRWHFIGALQTKKVPKIVGKFYLIHSVDTPELAQKIADCSQRAGATTAILLQANTSGEEAKQGLSGTEWVKNYPKVAKLDHIAIKGWMTMAPYTKDFEVIRGCFRGLKALRDTLTPQGELSMGMSNDHDIALEEGATLLRIGSLLFSD
jgi:pyridoxal phosphate enzyme (YggS family)